MAIYLRMKMSAIGRIIVLAQSWQSADLGDKFERGIDPTNIRDLVSLSTPTLSWFSDLESDVLFRVLSRLIDEYLIADQIGGNWGAVAIELGCIEDVINLQTICATTKRIGGDGVHTLFELPVTRSDHAAAESTAYLVFSQILNGALELVDCDFGRCGRRFIYYTRRRTCFCEGRCRKQHNTKLVRERKKIHHTLPHNYRRISIAIRALAKWLPIPTVDWRTAVLLAWCDAEEREHPSKLEHQSRRPSDRVPMAIGCRLLRMCIDAALGENNSDLTQKLMKWCRDDSAEDSNESLRLQMATLSELIRRAELIRKADSKANEEARIKRMFDKMPKRRTTAFL